MHTLTHTHINISLEFTYGINKRFSSYCTLKYPVTINILSVSSNAYDVHVLGKDTYQISIIMKILSHTPGSLPLKYTLLQPSQLEL